MVTFWCLIKNVSMILAQLPQTTTAATQTDWEAKVYPNGEAVIWKARKGNTEVGAQSDAAYEAWGLARLFWFQWCNRRASWSEAVLLGLLFLRNFDRVETGGPRRDSDSGSPCEVAGHAVARKGLKGITSYGARNVRNAAYLIEQDGGGLRTVFATCTVPSLPYEEMEVIHQRWHKVVEIYRLYLGRVLRDNNLSGESVTVSEIQEKRYQKSGLPILHIHTVFVGMRSDGKWAVTRECHDDIWRRALNVAGGLDLKAVPVSCQLKPVRKSAEGYISKYMSKGSKVVQAMVDAGFRGWMPKQWWNMSRSMRTRIDSETMRPNDIAKWLYIAAEEECRSVWKYHRDILVEFIDGKTMVIAKTGRLSSEALIYVKIISSREDST